MTAAAPRPEAPLVGATIFDQYSVVSLLLSDGVCDRYLVRPRTGGATALARVFVHPAFARGAEALWDAMEGSIQRLGMIEHPNVQRVLSAGVLDALGESRLCLVTEHVEGDSVETRARGARRIPLSEALTIAQRVLHGLAAIHQMGVVHADLRASNVRFVRGPAGSEGSSWPVLCDVAIGNLLLEAMGRPPSLRDQVFCVEALAPEQIEGEPVSVATDIYAFGALLYRMVTGTAPFRADDDRELLVAVLSEEPCSLAEGGVEAPPALEALVRRCLARHPAERFESTVALARALRDCEQGLVSAGRSPGGERSFFATGGATPLENKRPSRPGSGTSGLHTPRAQDGAVKNPDASARRPALNADALPPRSPLRAATLPPAPFALARRSEPPPSPSAPPFASQDTQDTSSPSSTAPRVAPAMRQAPPDLSRAIRWMGIALAVTLSLVVAATVALLQARRARLDTAVATLHAPRPLGNVRLTLRANVDGAQVLLRGRSYALPLRLEVPSGTEPELLEVSAAGHESQRLWVVLNGHTEVQVELPRVTPPSPPVAHVEPVGPRRHGHRERHERHERDLTRHPQQAFHTAEAAPGAAPTAEPITGEAIQRVVRQHRPEVTECIRRARQDTPTLTGRLLLTLVLAPDGTVRDARWNGNTPAHHPVSLCLTDAARRWTFPPTGSLGDLHVVYPIALR
jgi:serine/threonine-protein kinase